VFNESVHGASGGKKVDGRRLEFSAEKIKPFLSRDGIYGTFEMEITAEHKFLAIKRLN